MCSMEYDVECDDDDDDAAAAAAEIPRYVKE